MQSKAGTKTQARRLLREIAADADLRYKRFGDDIVYVGDVPILVDHQDLDTVRFAGERAVKISKAPTQLAAYMLRTGKTFADLTAVTGISRGLLHKYATGKVHPGEANATTICEATGVSIWPAPHKPGRPRKDAA